ncbi:hypothetical protein ACFE04_024046 [Oxalis oulophora]
MGERYFPIQMATRFVEEEQETSNTSSCCSSRAKQDIIIVTKLKRTALDLKDTIVKETWGLSPAKPVAVRDYTLYTGALGTAFLLFKAYQVTNNQNDLKLCSQIVKECQSVSIDSSRVTFICGRAGPCALGAVVAKHLGDERLLNHYLTQFKEIKLSSDLPNELLYGRAGFLWACSFLNKHIGEGTISITRMRAVIDEIIKCGRQMGQKARCPLMYEWHGKKYWGAAHGLAGIMHVLMDVELKQDEIEDVKGTLRYMINNRFPSGNFPSSEENESDRLVHWCHGAPGITLALVKAAEVFGEKEFLQAAMEGGELVWNRGLLKRVGICHGISGNTYVFISLYRLTGKVEYLYKAKAFASFLHDNASKLISEGKMHGGDRPYSLFEGIGGMAYLFLDMTEPSVAMFPAYQL